jgi:hypothetical protein
MAQTGHVYLQCGKWYVRLRMNFLENGKIVRKQKAIFLAEKSGRYRQESDLAELAQEKLAGVKAGEKCPQSAELFVEYVENTWIPFVARSKKPSTAAGYRSYWLRYIKPRVEGLALRDFTIAVVSSLLKDAAEMHTLNVDTVGKVRSILSAIFSYAIGNGHFPAKSAQDNPAHAALIPETATEPEETHTATWAEVKAQLAARSQSSPIPACGQAKRADSNGQTGIVPRMKSMCSARSGTHTKPHRRRRNRMRSSRFVPNCARS